jgi:hypothetical protein
VQALVVQRRAFLNTQALTGEEHYEPLQALEQVVEQVLTQQLAKQLFHGEGSKFCLLELYRK